MDASASVKLGWFQAFLYVFIFLAFAGVFGRYSAYIHEVNPIVFSSAAFASCAFILLLVGGKGALGKETMRSIDTWVYGLILMFSYIFGMLLLYYVTSTEATMLQKISIFLSFISSWFFLGRTPDKYQIIGVAIITIGVMMVYADIEGENTGAIYILSFIYGVMQTARLFTAELHRPHAKAVAKISDPRAKARVIGFVMFTMSFIFIVASVFVAFAQEHQGQPFILGLPMLEDFMHQPSIFLGLIMGVLIIAPSRILEFSSAHMIKAENFTMVTAFAFVSTLFWEWISQPLTGLSIVTISSADLVAGGFITIGALFISITRRAEKPKLEEWKEYISYETQNLTAVEDSREIAANTLEHFGGDIAKAARALDVPSSVISAFLDDKEKVLAFKNLPDIARIYRHKVAGCDPLTGLINRAGFMITLRNAPAEFKTFSILYLDLDKFKPVNDTHGHDAGDEILKAVADRLKEACPTDAIITRMGGDEYCVILPNADNKMADSKAEYLQQVIAKPFKVKGVKPKIEIGASIGIATYPEDGKTIEELLATADGGMYSIKNLRDDS